MSCQGHSWHLETGGCPHHPCRTSGAHTCLTILWTSKGAPRHGPRDSDQIPQPWGTPMGLQPCGPTASRSSSDNAHLTPPISQHPGETRVWRCVQEKQTQKRQTASALPSELGCSPSEVSVTPRPHQHVPGLEPATALGCCSLSRNLTEMAGPSRTSASEMVAPSPYHLLGGEGAPESAQNHENLRLAQN